MNACNLEQATESGKYPTIIVAELIQLTDFGHLTHFFELNFVLNISSPPRRGEKGSVAEVLQRRLVSDCDCLTECMIYIEGTAYGQGYHICYLRINM